MPVTISHQDYQDLFRESQPKKNLDRNDCEANRRHRFDLTWQYPEQLGQGTYQEIQLRQGIQLAIDHYQLHDDLIIESPERSHQLEYQFVLEGKPTPTSVGAGQYSLWGSGIAPIESNEESAAEPIVEVVVHIEPKVFQSFLGDRELVSIGLEHLMKNSDHCQYNCRGTTTVAMQTVLHQIIHCPFQDITKKIYLESKVWELMSLLVEEERQRHQGKRTALNLKPDDIDRLHHAREILNNSLENPPSLTELARQIGSNECTLKRGFREVFGTTAFGYLHEQRMEYARQLLITREFNVAQVAKKVGYATQTSLAIAFRKKFGVNPKMFMKEQHK